MTRIPAMKKNKKLKKLVPNHKYLVSYQARYEIIGRDYQRLPYRFGSEIISARNKEEAIAKVKEMKNPKHEGCFAPVDSSRLVEFCILYISTL